MIISLSVKKKKKNLHYEIVSAIIKILIGAHENPEDKMTQSKQSYVKFQQICKIILWWLSVPMLLFSSISAYPVIHKFCYLCNEYKYITYLLCTRPRDR